MIIIRRECALTEPVAAAMFADRKRLFVDLLGWAVPVVDDRYEIDQFDRDSATYLIATDHHGDHAGSLRLLPTVGPHILGDLFAFLCDDGVPRGGTIVEITRLCLPTRLSAGGRLSVRNRLISAMTDHALDNGIATLTGVVSWDFLEQIMAMGWQCGALGRPHNVAGARLGAFRIDLDADTPQRLSATGIYIPGTLSAQPARQAA